MSNTIIACDPGQDGAFAVFKHDAAGWHLDTFLRNTDWACLAQLELFGSIGVIESNHGIQGQPAGTSYTQGYNAGLVHRTLEVTASEVIKVIPQRWMKTFGVPKGMERGARKKWIREKAQKLTDTELPLWASDAVAIGLAYIKELKENV